MLARRVWPDGRTRAYVCGRSATLADLQELGSQLLSFYGQHEHRKLMLSTAQLDLLDAFCGPGSARCAASCAPCTSGPAALTQRATELRELAGARERELDLVRFELDEIEAAAPSEEEEAALTPERDRLRHLETLQAAAAAGAEAIAPEAGVGVSSCSRPPPASSSRRPRSTRSWTCWAAPGGAALRGRGHRRRAARLSERARRGAMAPPGLEEVEERLACWRGWSASTAASSPKCWSTPSAAARGGRSCEHADEALEAAGDELAAAVARRDELAAAARRARRERRPKLAAAVRARLGELAMPDARFEIELGPRAEGCGPRGAEAIEMLIAPNAAARWGRCARWPPAESSRG